MSNTEIQLIARLFEFMSAYKADELSNAASSSLITNHVRAALIALAKARAEDRAPVQVDPNGGESKQTRLTEAQALSLLEDPGILKSNADILRAVNAAGISMSAAVKESRSRLVGRIRKELATLPARERDLKCRQLVRELRPNQTEGWFKVIRRDS